MNKIKKKEVPTTNPQKNGWIKCSNENWYKYVPKKGCYKICEINDYYTRSFIFDDSVQYFDTLEQAMEL